MVLRCGLAVVLCLLALGARSGPRTPAQQVGRIESKRVTESSGIAASLKNPGVFWTHNDSGSAARLYAFNKEGKLLGECLVDARNDDWEDITADEAGRLYIGNLGNNRAVPGPMEVYRIAEPDPDKSPEAPLKVEKTWRLKYPGKEFDCESLFLHGKHGYVISKMPPQQVATIYRFPLESHEEELALEKVVEVPIYKPVTAAAIAPDGKRLAILSTGGLHVFVIGGQVERAAQAQQTFSKLPRGKLEGVCFAPEGIVLTAESGEVYLVPLPAAP